MRAPMASQHKKRRFIVSNPGAELSRQEAIELIRRHSDGVRVLPGLFADLSDEQIDAELPEAWRHEHAQADLFRDAPDDAADNARDSRDGSHWIGRIWHSLTRGM